MTNPSPPEIKTSSEIKASISFNKGYEHFNSDPNQKWIEFDYLSQLRDKILDMQHEGYSGHEVCFQLSQELDEVLKK